MAKPGTDTLTQSITIHGPVGDYLWHENWITIPDRAMETDGRTHGIAVSRDGRIFIFHQARPAMLVYSPAGQLLDTWGDYEGAHGITLVEEDGREYLWLADEKRCVVHKTDLSGKVALSLDCPSHNVYSHGGRFVPTQVAVNEKRFGGNGDIWLADGYGSNLVHRFNAAGIHLSSLSGEESGLPFRCPHGISVISVHGRRELWVADRSNKVIQVFDEFGSFQRRLGADFLISPNGFVQTREWILVPELLGRLTVINNEGSLLGVMGENRAILNDSQWPDAPACGILKGKFNSPHFAAIDQKENIFVGEWFHGGRVIKLERLPKQADHR